MMRDDTIRVLILANEFVCAQISRSHGRTGTGIETIAVQSREDFLREMHTGGLDAVVMDSRGFHGLQLSDVLDKAAESLPAVPIVVLGADNDDEPDEDGSDAIPFLEAGATEYIPNSQIARLPMVLRHLRRDRESLARQHDLEGQVRQAHEGLLENQKLMTVGRLAASIAHEINNPLESITNLLYLLQAETGMSDTAHHYIRLAEREMERVAQISKQTLNFYRETRTAVRVRPSELLEEVLVLYARQIEDRRIEVVRQYKTEASLVVFPGEMRQVFSNLVTNAIEASPVGGRLTLRIHDARMWSDEGIRGIRIVVADNGCGIPAEIRQNLGQPFYTTKGQRGTGLGLWVTRAIVRRYGGEIQLYSSTRQGRQGTVFSVFIPTNMRPQAVAPENNPTGSGGDGQRTAKLAFGSNLREAGGGPYGTETALRREFKRRRKPPVAS